MKNATLQRFLGMSILAVVIATAGFGQQKPMGSWDTQFDTQGLNGPALALTRGGGYIYAGGNFTMAGPTAANNIARWNGSSWSALGTGTNGNVSEIVVSGGNVYAGGSFTAAGGVTANNIAVWNGSSWSALGNGVNGHVYAIAVDGSNVYVGGEFSQAGGVSVNNIAVWNGSSWSALGSGITHIDPGEMPIVYDILIWGDVYAGGQFKFVAAGGFTAHNVARWDGSDWNAVGKGIPWFWPWPISLETHVLCLETDWTSMFAGTADEWHIDEWMDSNLDTYFIHFAKVCQWDGTNWTTIDSAAVGSTGNPKIHKLDYDSGYLYAGGEFTQDTIRKGDYIWISHEWLPPIFGNGISQYDGTDWNPLDSGVNGIVYDLSASSFDVWVAGDFSTAGGLPSYNIGRYVMGVTPNLTLIRVPFHYPTIQQAIDAATDGDTILVDPGVYPISDHIKNDHVNNLLLMGSRKEDGSDASVIQATANPGTYMCLLFKGVHGCTITGFEIRDGHEGIALDNCSDCIVKDCYLTNNVAGVAVWNSTNMEISYCIADQNLKRGIEIWQSNTVLVDHNTVIRSQNQEGVDISGTTDHLTINSNIFAYNNEAGIETNGLSFTSFVHDFNCFYSNPLGSVTGHNIGGSSILGDPMLVDVNSQNYYLQTGSPCIGAGEGGSDIGALGEFQTGVGEEPGRVARAFRLSRNYPNPFNPVTVIPYAIPEGGEVVLSVYNLRGEEVAVLFSGYRSAGSYRAEWDGRDASGRLAASGIYVYRLEAASGVLTRKMLFIR